MPPHGGGQGHRAEGFLSVQKVKPAYPGRRHYTHVRVYYGALWSVAAYTSHHRDNTSQEHRTTTHTSRWLLWPEHALGCWPLMHQEPRASLAPTPDIAAEVTQPNICARTLHCYTCNSRSCSYCNSDQMLGS